METLICFTLAIALFAGACFLVAITFIINRLARSVANSERILRRLLELANERSNAEKCRERRAL